MKAAFLAFLACVAFALGSFMLIAGGGQIQTSQAAEECMPRAIAPANIKDGEIPAYLIPIYQEAGIEYNVPWTLLAAINKVETEFGTNAVESSAGANGWMQFMPATWLAYGVDADGDGEKDPGNPRDAIFAAARYLAASGAPSDLRRAVFAYNHANWYVDKVLAIYQAFEQKFTPVDGGSAGPGTCVPADSVAVGNADVQSVMAAADELHKMRVPYNYGGGHVTPAKPTGGQEGPYLGLDCSSAVSWVLQHAGVKVPTMTSGGYMNWGDSGPGNFVTLYTNSGHIFMKIGDRYFGTSGFGHPPFTGAAWFTIPPTQAYLNTFVQRHPPGM